MPSSDYGHLMDVVNIIIEMYPQTMLEVGMGFGKYGLLSREILDLQPAEGGGFESWQKRIDGIEVCEKYITPVHKYIYSNIYIGNALDILDELIIFYDLMIAIDVLEHFNKKDAIDFINKAKKCASNIIISTPYVYYDQGEIFENPFEAHYSAWTVSDFKDMGAKYIFRSGISLIAVFTYEDYMLKCLDFDEFSKEDLKNMEIALSMYKRTNQMNEFNRLKSILKE